MFETKSEHFTQVRAQCTEGAVRRQQQNVGVQGQSLLQAVG